MEEDDETQSRPSPENSLSPDPPIGVTTTTAKSSASSPSPRDGLALMVSPPNRTRSGGRRRSGGGGGGGRDDCWSEEATEILIDAWGERFMELKRGNLKQQHWKEVAEIVNSERINKSVKSDIQCKNRIDTVKKKFKQEKAKIVSTGENSKWVFFNKLQHLIGEATTTTTTTVSKKGLMVTPSLQQKRQGGVKRSSGGASSARWHFRKRVASETESESEPDLSGDDDSLPPPLLLSPTVDKSGGGKEIGEVVMAILGFAESYEKAESLKIKQMVEIEKERMKFAKELELQRMEFFKNQLEMFQNVQDDEDGERRSKRSHHSVKDNGNVRD